MQQEIITYILVCLACYLYGSIPFALLIAKHHGIDLLNFGSGNLGGSNLGRACGKKAFVLCFILDMSKGAIAVLIAKDLGLNPLIVFPFAVLGHAFSIFIKFKGGKGIATCFGFALAYHFIFALIAITSFLIILKICKYVSLSSILAIFVYAFLLLIAKDYIGSLFVLVINIAVIYLHRSNIKRIIKHTERKITWM